MNLPARPQPASWITAGDLAPFAAAYPGRASPVGHALHDNPLFALEALADLAGRLPASHVEHSLGNLAIDQDPAAIPQAALTAPEIVRGIATNGCWMVLKKVDVDPAYAALIDQCLGEIAPIVAPRTGAYQRREAFIFLSSPNSVTPFHMDPEHNILLQIAGTKTMRVYPCDDPNIVSQEQHEAFHQGKKHRNMRFDPAFDAVARDFVLNAGEAVYVPVKAPHWVQNGPVPSISFSITWRSTTSDADARLHRVNHGLRALGVTPSVPGARPAMDAGKVAAHRLVKRATGLARKAMRRERDRAAY